MGRPTLHDPDALLDAAVRLFARDGARGLTVAAVAREAKAPSGSVYHRFPDRGSLLAAVWLRTVQRFHADYAAAHGDTATAPQAVAGVGWIVDRCRADLGEALVLQAGPEAFDPGAWPEASSAAWSGIERERSATISAVVRRVAASTGVPRAEVAFAMFDLPLAVVRRDLLAGTTPPRSAIGLAERLAARILDAGERG